MRDDYSARYFNLQYFKTNLTFFIFLTLYVIIQITLVVVQVREYLTNKSNNAIVVARAAGILLNFNMSFIVILVLKKLLTCLRSVRFMRVLLPIDDFIMFHKFIGCFILVLSVVHTIAHCFNLYWKYEEEGAGDLTLYLDLLFTRKSGIGWFYKISCPTGWAILALMLFIDLFTIPQIRRKKFFQAFLNMHRFYIVVYILTILHCSNFWKYFTLPVFLVLVETVLKCFHVKSANFGSTFIKEVNLLPSGVTHLILKRPKQFQFKAGDYVRIKIPVISISEYHAFTISSAPEDKDEISLHIRRNGDWTSRVYQYFSDYLKLGYYVPIAKPERTWRKCFRRVRTPEPFSDIVLTQVIVPIPTISADMENSQQHFKNVLFSLTESKRLENLSIDVRLDGPFGTISRHVFHTEHAVLIASGIGITPFSSILQSLWNKHSASIKTCSNCNHRTLEITGVKRLKKIDFIWVNREYESFEWFMSLLAELELQQTLANDTFIDIHLYWTDKNGEKSVAMQTFSQMIAAMPNEHLRRKIEEMFRRIKRGRPDFHQILKDISETKKNTEVFFCGNKTIGDVIRRECMRFKLKYSQEYF